MSLYVGILLGSMLVLFLIIAAICIAERKGSEEEKDYPLTLSGFAKIRTEWREAIAARRKPKTHSHSLKTYDELYTTRKEDHYENN